MKITRRNFLFGTASLSAGVIGLNWIKLVESVPVQNCVEFGVIWPDGEKWLSSPPKKLETETPTFFRLKWRFQLPGRPGMMAGDFHCAGLNQIDKNGRLWWDMDAGDTLILDWPDPFFEVGPNSATLPRLFNSAIVPA